MKRQRGPMPLAASAFLCLAALLFASSQAESRFSDEQWTTVLRDHSIKKTVILAYVNFGVRDLLKNWWCSLQALGLSDFVVAVALDGRVFELLQDMRIAAVRLEALPSSAIALKCDRSPGRANADAASGV